jgi:hypothetical protein
VAVAGQNAWPTTAVFAPDTRFLGFAASILTTGVLLIVTLLVGQPRNGWGEAATVLEVLLLVSLGYTPLPGWLRWVTTVGPLIASAALVAARVRQGP